MSLTPTEVAALSILARVKVDPLCPKCGHRRCDPKSENGWCVKCDAQRARQLESKRVWWERNRGAGAAQ